MRKRRLPQSFLPLLFTSAASGQVTTGMAVTKTCPDSFITPGATFTCTFTVQNLDPANTVTGLVVTNTPQGSSPTAIPCSAGGNPVTTLQPKGTPGDLCAGSVLETAPACQATISVFSDVIGVAGTDSGTNGPVFSSGSGAIRILPCTPTPNGTLTNTPVGAATATPTSTAPTNTPTATTTRTNPPTMTATATPTSVATATPTSPSARRHPRQIPFRPTITATGETGGSSFPPLALLAAVMTGAWVLTRR